MHGEIDDELDKSIKMGITAAMTILLIASICYCSLKHWLRNRRAARYVLNLEGIELPIQLRLPTYEEATRVTSTAAVASPTGEVSTSGVASVPGVAGALTTRRRRRRRSRRSETADTETHVDGSNGESYTGESSNDNDSTVTRIIGDDSGVSFDLGENSGVNPSGSQNVSKSNAADDSGMKSGHDDTVDRVDNVSISSTYYTASGSSIGGGSFRVPSPWLEF